MWRKLTPKARAAVFQAQKEAELISAGYVATEQLLIAICSSENSAGAILQAMGVSPRLVIATTRQRLPKGAKAQFSALTLTPRALVAMKTAEEEAQELGHSHVGTQHILLGLILEEDGLAARVLTELGLNPDAIRGHCAKLPVPSKSHDPETTSYSRSNQGVQVADGFISIIEPKFQGDFFVLILLSRPTAAILSVLDRLDLSPALLTYALENEMLLGAKEGTVKTSESYLQDGLSPRQIFRRVALLGTSYTARALRRSGKTPEEIQAAFEQTP